MEPAAMGAVDPCWAPPEGHHLGEAAPCLWGLAPLAEAVLGEAAQWGWVVELTPALDTKLWNAALKS